jgi:D-sedoheptulose 7-phosphate isomerase
MTTLKTVLDKAERPADFARAYADYLERLLRALDTGAVAAFIEELERAWAGRHTVFIAGNGGSAATAAHMVNDLSFGIRPGPDGPSLDVRSLADNVPLLTAIANDHAYDEVFVRQLALQYRQGDCIVLISASGNSPNIIRAAEWAKARGARIVGLVGFDGGRLRDLSDVVIHVATAPGEYGPVEDLHLVIDHMVTLWLQARSHARFGVAAAR